MKFPKLFGRKKDDEDEEFDEDEFDVSDLEEDGFVDDDEGEPEAEYAGADDDDMDDGDETVGGDTDAVAEDADEIMVGVDDEIENPFEGEDEDEFDGPDFDDEDDEGEEDEASSRKKAILFAAIGAGVLLLSGLGGAGWWYFSGPSEGAGKSAELDPGQVEMAMPPLPGSLNAGGGGLNSLGAGQAGADAQPPQSQSAEPQAPSPAADAAQQPTELASGGLNSLNTLGSTQAGGGLVVPAVASASLARIPDQPSAADQSKALSNAPIKTLLEEKDGIGDVPKVGPTGVQPWQSYARPSDPSITLPKIALLIEGVGLSRQASLGVINKLPAEIAMVLSPYGRDLNDWVFRSRLAGHEVYVSLPMESDRFPIEDAGPLALDTRIQVAENQKRLDMVMASAGGYVGLVTMMGSQFLKAQGQLRDVLKTLNNRGIMFVIGGNRRRNDAMQIATDLNMPRAESEMYIDETPRIQQIRTNLDRLESIAKTRGYVVAMARPYPVTIQSILDWYETIGDKGIALVPPSALAIMAEPTQ